MSCSSFDIFIDWIGLIISDTAIDPRTVMTATPVSSSIKENALTLFLVIIVFILALKIIFVMIGKLKVFIYVFLF